MPSRSPRRPMPAAALIVAAVAVCSGLVGAGRGAVAAPPVGAALQALGHSGLRQPGSLPDPSVPAGTDTLPGVDHIVVLMMENHSFDNLFGMLGRGDGFTLGPDGQPTATNPYPDGSPVCPATRCLQHAFHMPTTCQLSARPSQEWQASHNAYDGGANDGFVRTTISPATSDIVGGVAMGYWTGADLPFTYSLASQFPIADRWFSSALAQTHPERRFLIAGTASGMTDDVGSGPGNAVPDAGLAVPAPTIFNELDAFGISWADYVGSKLAVVPGQPARPDPEGETPNLYPTTTGATEQVHARPFEQFAGDAAAGRLPSFSLLDEDFGTQSQENPQNIVVGERMMSEVVHELGDSPQWPSTLLVITYDEHGGYYDHVPPPPAIAPDAVPPQVQPTESAYDGFARYGFRVPAVVVSPYAKRRYVSHVLYDHTSVLAMVERKWNLPALTLRDANANDLTDFLDLRALARRHPTFRALPPLADPGDTRAALACATTGPGTIPPPGSISPA